MTIDNRNREGTVIVYNAAAAQQIVLRGNRKRFGIFPEIANQQTISIQPVPCAIIRIVPAQQSPFIQTILQVAGLGTSTKVQSAIAYTPALTAASAISQICSAE